MYQFYRHLKAVLGSLYRDAVIVIQNHPGSFLTRFWPVTKSKLSEISREAKISLDSLPPIIEPKSIVAGWFVNRWFPETRVLMPLTPESSPNLIQPDFDFAYDSAGNVGKITHAGWTFELGHTSTYNYDSKNRLTGLIDALGHSTSYAYDAIENLPRAAETLYGLDCDTNSDFSDRVPRTTSYAYTRLYPK